MRSSDHSHIQRETEAMIDIHVGRLSQPFDALDPAPLQARALAPNAERYILGRVGKQQSTEPWRLLLHFPESLRPYTSDATDGIHEHFRRSHAEGERDFRRRLRIGRFALAAGRPCALRQLRATQSLGGLGEPRIGSGARRAVLSRLASIPIEFVFQPNGSAASMT